MRRKLIRQGAGTLTFSIPKKWAEDHNLKHGDELEVNESAGDLHLSTSSKPKRREFDLDVPSNDEWFIRINLNDLYRLGYDTIRMKYADEHQAKIAAEVVSNHLLGFEVIEKKNGTLTIDNVAEPGEEKQEVLLRRMFLLIKESFTIIKEPGSGKLEQLRKHTQKVSQYDNFCRRSISKKIFQEERANFYWALYNYLLLIQHGILRTYEFIVEQKKFKPSKETAAKLAQVEQAFDILYDAFFKKDLAGIKKANEIARAAYHTAEEALFTTKGPETVMLHRIHELGRLTYLTSAPALGILLR